MSPRKPKQDVDVTPPANAVEDVEFSAEARAAMVEFGSYANSRTIPDVRDGLKSGARRTLWAIFKAGAVPGKPTRKSALLAGAVLAYHPHGDAGIYDGMVTMAHVPSDGKPVKKVVPLLHGQGGWGDLDFGAAASRYTEARLNDEAMMLLGDSEEVLGKGEQPEIAENGVRMVKNYSGELDEPTVLPALWPQFVINGAEGIGVGVSTMSPGHNPNEALDLALALVDTDNPRWDTVSRLMPGPDLPADCDIYDIDGGIKSYMTTGRGQFMMRARYTIEQETKRGVTRHIMVVTGLPFRVSPTMVMEGITQAIEAEELPPMAMRNLSDGNGMRLEIDLGTGDPEPLVQRLLYYGRKTRLQEPFSVHSWAIVDNQVQRVSTIDALRAWVAHRRTVIRHRTKYRLDKAEERLEVVVGLLKAVPIAHLIVEVVRASANRAEAAAEMTKRWGFTDRQNQAILDMNVGQLSKIGVERYESEREHLEARIKECKDILGNPKVLNARLKAEIRAAKKHFAGVTRRCTLMDGDARVERPKATVAVVPAKKVLLARTSTYFLRQVAKRNIAPVVGVDHVTGFIETTNHDFVDVVTNLGNVTRLRASTIPDKATRADMLVSVGVGERCVFASSHPGGADLITVSASGMVKRTGRDTMNAMRPTRAYNVQPIAPESEVAWAFHSVPGTGERLVAITAHGYVLAVNADDPVFRAKARSSKGNPLINLARDDSLIWVGLLCDDDRVVAWNSAGGTFTFKASQIETFKRGVKGRLVHQHKAPLVGAVGGSGRMLCLFHPEMESAREIDVKSLTSGTEVKRPGAVEGIAGAGTVVWLSDGSAAEDEEPS